MNKVELSSNEYFDMLMGYEGNIKMYGLLREYFENDQNRGSIIKAIEQSEETYNSILNSAIQKMLEEFVFPTLVVVYLFHKKDPLKCIEWIKSTLNSVFSSFAEIIKELVLIGLRDENRMRSDSQKLQFIIQELESFDSSNPQLNNIITVPWITYFEPTKGINIGEFIDAYATVMGLIKSKRDIIEEFILKNEPEILSFFKEKNLNIPVSRVDLGTVSTPKEKPEMNKKQILFKNSETIDQIHSELKGFFSNKEAELLKVLQGEQLDEILLFPHNQNKFVEVFRRLKYNGFLLNNDTEIKNWICTTFQFVKNGFAEPQPFNENTVWSHLSKGNGEPTKKARICINEKWLPYKTQYQLKTEAQKEKL